MLTGLDSIDIQEELQKRRARLADEEAALAKAKV
jgi:hypothetical protein